MKATQGKLKLPVVRNQKLQTIIIIIIIIIHAIIIIKCSNSFHFNY